MRAGAYATHRGRTSLSEATLRAEIGKRRDSGQVVNVSVVAAAVGMSREHLSRRYNHLFSAQL
jgi:hypothetical protein